eukprot:TCALIF_11869-PA protein Name:"Protein of unknown function" AED:0.06 eAED:0.43 QI:561/1/0.66/1/0/0/3/0/158
MMSRYVYFLQTFYHSMNVKIVSLNRLFEPSNLSFNFHHRILRVSCEPRMVVILPWGNPWPLFLWAFTEVRINSPLCITCSHGRVTRHSCNGTRTNCFWLGSALMGHSFDGQDKVTVCLAPFKTQEITTGRHAARGNSPIPNFLGRLNGLASRYDGFNI